MDNPASQTLFVGVDVAKDSLDLALSNEPKTRSFPNNPQGHKAILALLAPLAPKVVLLEATGGLERPLVDALLEAGLPAARVHPAQVRHFAKATGQLAKTDALDARLLARFAQACSPRLLERQNAAREELHALVECRRQFVHTRTQHNNRRQAATAKPALKAQDAVLKVLDKQIRVLDQRIAKLIDQDDDLAGKAKILQSAPGVGPVLAATLLAEMSQLGSLARTSAAALAGLAPMDKQSGPRQGSRHIQGGRAEVRNALYMPTLAAMRGQGVIPSFAARLRKAGKLPKVVITACMRKLLVLLNAMLRDDLTWDQLNVVKNPAPNP